MANIQLAPRSKAGQKQVHQSQKRTLRCHANQAVPRSLSFEFPSHNTKPKSVLHRNAVQNTGQVISTAAWSRTWLQGLETALTGDGYPYSQDVIVRGSLSHLSVYNQRQPWGSKKMALAGKLIGYCAGTEQHKVKRSSLQLRWPMSAMGSRRRL
eukprot:scaffold42469_cov18-Tisochrysis_lutea.AAC.3